MYSSFFRSENVFTKRRFFVHEHSVRSSVLTYQFRLHPKVHEWTRVLICTPCGSAISTDRILLDLEMNLMSMRLLIGWNW